MFKTKIINCIFQIEVNIGFLFDVQQYCRAHQYLSFSSKEFINHLDIFFVKPKIITILIQNVWDLTLCSSFKS